MESQRTSLWVQIKKYRYFYLLALPALIYFAIFRYGSMWGLLLAFQNYNPFKGFWESQWVGLQNFKEMFADPFFLVMLRNTIVISFLKLILVFPLPIALAIQLNEVHHEGFKRINQTIVYFPHFLSWVVCSSLTFFMLSSNIGFINKAIVALGGEQIPFLIDKNYFWLIIIVQTIWKETGWSTIIFMAAITGIDLQLYEAATIDGASRMKRIWHVTLPSIMPTIVILLILRLGQVFDVGFEQIILMQNSMVRDVSEIFDTYSYNQGILQGRFSLGVTVGLFKSVVGLVFLMGSNFFAKKAGSEGLF